MTDGFGKMHKRRREAVIRFKKYNKDKEPSNYYRARLMLYYPWRNENVDLIGEFPNYLQHYESVSGIVIANEAKYSVTSEMDVEYDENGPSQHVWEGLTPGNEESRLRSLQDNEVTLTNVNREDLVNNSELMTESSNSPSLLLKTYESAANKEIIPPDEYRKLFKQLNAKQRGFILYHRNWCKKAVVALKAGKAC